MITTIPKVLGFLLYHSPQHAEFDRALNILPAMAEGFDESNQATCNELIASIDLNEDRQTIEQRFNELFIGVGDLAAPPWGSVYLDSEGIVMGETTVDYRQFLATNGIELQTDMNEPEDQFGLMLMTFAELIDKERFEAAATLLEVHLLTWAPRYLSLLEAQQAPLYSQLASLASIYLKELQAAFELSPIQRRLFR